MPPTGDTSERAGVYRAPCCDEEVELQRGQRFPVCSRCEKPANWTFIRPLDHKKAPAFRGRPVEQPRM
jgi:hypothetical protein